MRSKAAIVFACGLRCSPSCRVRSSSNSLRRRRRARRPLADREAEAAVGGRGGAPIPFDNVTGFDKIFDGATLANWEGDPGFWRVEGGAIVGETTAEKPLSENTFLIYRGSEPDNFELKLEFRMNSTNSGVQYRSRQLTGAVGKWVLCGYQADIDFANSYTGMLYEERGRPGFLAPRGTVQYAGPNDVKQGQCSSGQPVAPRGQGAGRAGGDAGRGAARIRSAQEGRQLRPRRRHLRHYAGQIATSGRR